jgi:hypothetical protein
MQPLIPLTKILQWQLGLNLQSKRVVLITTEKEGGKVCLEYRIFYIYGPTFILIGVRLCALLRGVDDGGNLKLAIGHKEFSTNFSCTINHTVEEELEEDPLQQVMASTLEKELSTSRVARCSIEEEESARTGLETTNHSGTEQRMAKHDATQWDARAMRFEEGPDMWAKAAGMAG